MQYFDVTTPLLKCITLQKNGRNTSARSEIIYFAVLQWIAGL